MKQIITIVLTTVIISLQILLIPVYGETDQKEEKELTLYAQSAVLMDAASGRVLYGKNEQLPRPMASTTKIMTCILALEYGNLEDVVIASSHAASQPKVHLGVHTKETFYLKDLLYSLMLESHNDAAVMIAEHIGGSVSGFADLMNQKARDLGCDDTYFITPNGLDAEIEDKNGVKQVHSTTAADLSRIMKYCITESPKRNDFLAITQTQNYFFTDVNGKRSFQCVNHNALLTMMNGVLSGKTGFTGGAGYSYVAALEDEGRTFVIALLGCGWPPHKTYKWTDARTLLNYGKEKYKYIDVFEEKEFSAIKVKDGIPSNGNLEEEAYTHPSMNLSQEEKSLPLLMSEAEEVTITYDIPEQLEAPVKKGMTIGTVIYRLEGKVIKTYPVFADTKVERIDLSWCVRKVVSEFMLAIQRPAVV